MRRANLSAKKVKEKYRKRFGIEARVTALAKTRSAGGLSSANAAYRFMLIGMSFLLTNIWQELRPPLDEKSPSHRERVGIGGAFRLKRARQFLEKSDRKTVWNDQRNRNAELKSANINQIWIY